MKKSYEINGSTLTIVGEGFLKGAHKFYKIYCSKCSKDTELFPDKFFYARKYTLSKGKAPCFCSGFMKNLSEDQWKVLVKRELPTNISFIDFKGQFKGNTTKCVLYCHLHDMSCQASITDIRRLDDRKFKGCRSCAESNRMLAQKSIYKDKTLKTIKDKLPTSYKILSSIEGVTQNDKVEVKHDCGASYLVKLGSILNGSRCPFCSKTGIKLNKPTTLYLCKWTNTITKTSLLKIGLTNRELNTRLREQRKRNDKYSCELLYSITKPTGFPLREIELKYSETPVVTKEDFPDGFTETLTYTKSSVDLIIRDLEGL